MNNTSGPVPIKIKIPSFETDETSLYLYGMVPFRYISVRALRGNIVLNDIEFSYCDCC
jgi:hypothetical protein